MDKSVIIRNFSKYAHTYDRYAKIQRHIGVELLGLIRKKEDKYVLYYAKQSLVIFVIAIIGGIINSILMWIPVLGWFIIVLINITIFLLWLASWIYALSGEEIEIPIVSNFAEKINL